MIEYVTRDSATWAEVPHKFEAGTVSAGDAVGMGAAIRYIQMVGLDKIEKHDIELTCRLVEGIKKIPHVKLVGPEDGEKRAGIVTMKQTCMQVRLSFLLSVELTCATLQLKTGLRICTT